MGVTDALAGLGIPLSDVSLVVHGTTLGLNAVLERKGAETGLIATAGFTDVLEIGRGDVPFREMYNLNYQRPAPMIHRRRIRGVGGRMLYTGEEKTALDEESVALAAKDLVDNHGVTSIAVAYLHSYANAKHELATERIIKELYPSVSVTLSNRAAREYREYERTSSTVLAAYIRPIIDRYLSRLTSELQSRGFSGSFWVMRSGGGAMTAEAIKDEPLTTIFSGPAGGVAGAVELARNSGREHLLSFDVGGTSLDTCVIDSGAAASAYEARLGDMPMLTPVFDLRTIGAGGGSIAWLDDGLLKVGPRSAGSEPGPACYERGGMEPTVTDASVVLGFLSPEEFLSGQMSISKAAAETAVRSKIAEPLGLDTTVAAAGIMRMVASHTVGAIRELTVERGADPRDFSLVAFGGAGPLLASLVMREMDLKEVLIPVAPGVFSAWGMLFADLEYDVVRTSIRILSDDALAEIEPLFAEMVENASTTLAAQGVDGNKRQIERRVDVRYRFQEHSLTLSAEGNPTAAELRARFDRLHRQQYGHTLTNEAEILNLRVHAVGFGRKPRTITDDLTAEHYPQPIGHREAFDYATESNRPFNIYRRTELRPGAVLSGPSIVLESACNVIVPSGAVLRVDSQDNLLITMEGTR